MVAKETGVPLGSVAVDLGSETHRTRDGRETMSASMARIAGMMELLSLVVIGTDRTFDGFDTETRGWRLGLGGVTGADAAASVRFASHDVTVTSDGMTVTRVRNDHKERYENGHKKGSENSQNDGGTPK